MLESVLRRFKKNDNKQRPAREFSLSARSEDASVRLVDAAQVAERISLTGEDFRRKGFSTGGFTAEILTASGQKDGPPKMDPVTVAVHDKSGNPLFLVEILSNDFRIRGATSAVAEKLKGLPAD